MSADPIRGPKCISASVSLRTKVGLAKHGSLVQVDYFEWLDRHDCFSAAYHPVGRSRLTNVRFKPAFLLL